MTYFKDNLLFLRKKNNLTQVQLGLKIGVGRTTITNYESGVSEPSYELLQNIVKQLDVSIDEIINTDIQLMEEDNPNVNNFYQIASEPMYEYGRKPITGIPLIPSEAFAGVGTPYDNSYTFDKIEDRYIVPLFEGKGIDFLISVKGSSMYPKYSSGDIVACKLLEERLFVQWNKVYVIDTKSQGTMIKRLRKSTIENHILCRSDNKDYDDFDIPNSDIRNMAIVLGVIRLE